MALRVRGEVQGVGFRPTVVRLARDRGVTGFVQNTPEGVRVEVQGSDRAVGAVLGGLRGLRPPIRVDDIELQDQVVVPGEVDFVVLSRIEPDRASRNWRVAGVGHQRDHAAGIDAATQERTQRDITDHAGFDTLSDPR